MGVPFQSLPLYTDIELTSDFQLVNFLMGKGLTGELSLSNTLVDMASYYLFDTARTISKAQAQLPEAHAQEPSYPIVTRGFNYETTQTSLHNYTSHLGLPEYIQRFDGVWISHEYWEDANMVTFNSADLSFVFDKNTCSYTLYNDGRIFNNSTEVIKSDTWIVKFAENGTDNWADVPQQSLGCTTEVLDFPDDTFQIKYTKSDSLGEIESIMNKTVSEGMKHIISYTNNNPSWNNTKIGFSHILQGTPESLSILTKTEMGNQTSIKVSKYSTNSTIPDTMANIATIVDEQNPIDIPYTDLMVNGTMIPDGFTFHFTDSEKKQIHYDFDQGLEKLWNIRFLDELNGNVTETKVYLDYMNEPAILGIGNTTTIDPVVTALTPQVRRLSVIGTGAVAPTGCANNGLGCTGNNVDSTFTYLSNQNNKFTPFVTYDISSIPSNADVQQVRLGHGVTQIFNIINRASVGANIYTANGEDFQTLLPQQLADCMYPTPHPWGDVSPFNGITNPERNDGRMADGQLTSNPCGIRHISGLDSPTAPNNAALSLNAGADVITHDSSGELATDMETRFLQLGLTKWTYIICNSFFDELHLKDFLGSVNSAAGHGLSGCAATVSNPSVFAPAGDLQNAANGGGDLSQTFTSNIFFSIDGNSPNTFLEVTYVVLTQASAPISLTCNPTSPTSVDLDWFPPSDLGGAQFVDGYRIQRDSGGGFTDLVSDTGSALTFFTDNTVSAGTTFKYRVSAITGFGEGVLSSEVSCGVSGVSNQVTDLTATNQALNVVALDWTEPTFTGNTPITGYQVDRTSGTPSTDNNWQFIQHKREAKDTRTLGSGVTILNVFESTGWFRLQGVSDTTVEGILLSTQADGLFTDIGHTYLFKDFAKEDLAGRTVEFRWDQFKQPAGFSLQTFGDWETRAFIVDGVYDLTGANTVGGTGDFPAQVAGVGLGDNVGLHLPSVGNGVIFDCMDLDNVTVLLGGNPTNTALPNTAQMESANQHDIKCNLDDLSGASQDRVTVVFQLYDNQVGLNPCGSNCASVGNGAIVMDFIDIAGLGIWDFSNDLPLDTIVNFDSPSVTSPLPMKNVVGDLDIQNFQIGDGFITLVADTGNTNVEFLDNTVLESTSYGYRVFALNSEGTSPSSNIAQVFTAGAPTSPEPITVTAIGTQTISIDWNDADLNGGTLVGYEIERKQGVGGIFSTLTTVTTTDHTDGTGLFTLVPATEYCYHVKTITNIGSSAFTTEQCATTFDAPAVVENLVVTALDGSSVDMSFDTPLSDGGSPITGFKVERKIGAGSFVTLDALTLIQTRNDTGLPIGTLIEYRVSASNQFGFGNTVTVGDTTDATPQVPQNLVCSAGSPTSINLSWDTPLTFSPPTGYEIARNVDGSAFTILVADTASTGTTFNDPSLSTTSIYGYRILAHTAEGDTLFTDDVFCKTLGIPVSPPENFIATFPLVVPHEITLTWDIPNTFGIPIQSFVVERDDGAGFNEIANLPPNAVGMIDTSPDNDIQQKYRVKLTGSLGDTPYSVGISSVANQISHWNYEKSPDDVGLNKNTGTVIGTANFNNTLHNGLAHTFDGSTRIEVDSSQESDYDFDNDSFGITTYYEGSSSGMLVSKASSLTATGYKFFIDSTGVPSVRLTATAGTDEIHILGSTNVTDNSSHFLGLGYNGNQTASGVSLMVDGVFETKNVITDNLVGSILNNDPLVLGADSSGTNTLNGTLDETRFFGSGTLDDDQMLDVFNEEIETIAPINATMSLSGSTFSDISSEEPILTLNSGFPIPTITGNLELKNFTTTTVNTASGLTIPASGVLNVPALFNTMGSTSNYTTLVTLDNGLEVFFVLSNEDLQSPQFSLPAGIDFFFQHARDPTFKELSFNFTRTVIPFDLSCNLKSELFADGETFTFTDVGFIQNIFDVPATKDVVVACIDPNSPILNPDEPSFGGSNALLTFVSFGDTTGIGAFLNFTDNYGDFFGAPLPFLFVILIAALFTGRSAPTGIIIVGLAIGIMWFMEILTVDPILWGVIITLVILGAIGGKKFL